MSSCMQPVGTAVRQSRSRAGPRARMWRPPLRYGSPVVLGFEAVAELAAFTSFTALKHAATSQSTRRAARAATNPVLLGATDARAGLPGCDFVEPFANYAGTLHPGCLSGRRYPLWAHCGAASSGLLGSARAARFVNILGAACLNAASKASEVSSAPEPKRSNAAESQRSGDRHAVSPQWVPPDATREQFARATRLRDHNLA
jgi:hypothetical protein